MTENYCGGWKERYSEEQFNKAATCRTVQEQKDAEEERGLWSLKGTVRLSAHNLLSEQTGDAEREDESEVNSECRWMKECMTWIPVIQFWLFGLLTPSRPGACLNLAYVYSLYSTCPQTASNSGLWYINCTNIHFWFHLVIPYLWFTSKPATVHNLSPWHTWCSAL